MASATAEKRVFISPKHKLIAFFVRSRDGWKGKCMALRVRLKQHQILERDVQASREMWRSRATEAEVKIADLQATIKLLQNELGEKKIPGPLVGPR